MACLGASWDPCLMPWMSIIIHLNLSPSPSPPPSLSISTSTSVPAYSSCCYIHLWFHFFLRHIWRFSFILLDITGCKLQQLNSNIILHFKLFLLSFPLWTEWWALHQALSSLPPPSHHLNEFHAVNMNSWHEQVEVRGLFLSCITLWLLTELH